MDNASVSSITGSSRFRGEMLNKIYRIWLFRKLAPVFAVEIVVLSLLLYGFGKFVFVERIFENASKVFFQNPSGILSFSIAAFLHASVATKFLTIGLVVLIALLMRLITQGILRFILVKENYFRRM